MAGVTLLCLLGLGTGRVLGQLTVSISGPSSVCPGSTVSYFADAQGGTGTYTYQWLINGELPIGSASSSNTLTTTSLSGGQVLSCYVQSQSGGGAMSNGITITAVQPQAFSINITTSSYTVCSGSTVTFTATSSLPISTVQWQDAAAAVEANGTTFTAPATSASALESISVTATTAGACVSNSSATSTTSSIPFTVLPLSYPSVSISQSPVPALEGSPVTFTATPSGQGTSPVYQWQLNGVVVPGVISSTYTPTITTGSDVQSVSVSMTSTGTCPQNAATAASLFQLVSSDWENQNYIREQQILIPGITNWISIDGLSIGQKRERTSYLDGLGRVIQALDKSGSLVQGNSTDLVKPVSYDQVGRNAQQYLPYTTTDNPGKFKSSNVLLEQAAFVTNKFGEPAGAPTYTQNIYDNSPVNRIIDTYAPGQSWGGSSVGVSANYDFNNSNNTAENVHIWSLAYSSTATPTTSPTAVYSTGMLYKTTSTDENGKQTITYTDFSGNTILNKVQMLDSSNGLTAQHAGWACTYYVYNDLNQLQFTIPPAAVTYLDNNGWNLTQQLVNDLCFVYTYDAQGRTISKKQPGIGETDVVFDQRGRPVFTQDANGRANNQWQGTIYDGLDRVTSTGILSVSITTAALQSSVNSSTGNSTVTAALPPSTVPNLVVTGQQDGVTLYEASQSITFEAPYSSDVNGTFSALIVPLSVSQVNEVVVVPDQPVPSGSSLITLTQTFYDDYSHATRIYTAADNSLFDPSTDQQALPLPAQNDPQTRGKVTTTLVKVISNPANLSQGSTWLETDVFYDSQGRILQNQKSNALNGTDVITNRYDFAGKLWGSCFKHMVGSPTQFTVVSRNAYDALGRLTDISKNFNGTYFKDLASYAYDEYGNLTTKTLAPGYTGSGKNAMETLAYSYNIRGWLTGINSPYALDQTTGDQWNDFFGLYLGYDNRDNQFAAARLDGKLTGVIWKSQGDNSMRKYDYTYDDLGRLTSGLFNQRLTPADNWSKSAVDLSEYIAYLDANGNIHSMEHMGIVPGVTGGVVVDNLTYTYGSATDPNVNVLYRVDEAANFAGNGQLDDFKDGTNAPGTNDYIYDNDGNLIQDQNKGITDGASGGVVYNYLNKPVSITIAGKSLVQYTYDANGVKMTKTVTNLAVSPNTTTTTTYDDQFVYQNNSLQYVLHEEGRMTLITPVNTPQIQLNAGSNPAAVITGEQGVFEYFIKDQLSNVRMVLTEESQTEFYIATMEISSTADPNLGTDEAKLFGQVDPTTGDPTPNNEVNVTRALTPSMWTSNTSAHVADLTAAGTGGTNQTIGPNMLLKVSAGDMINASAAYYYYTNGTTGSSTGVSDALTALMGALLTANVSGIAETNSALINSSLGSPSSNFATFINNNNPTGSIQTPNAYLNILFFDEQFNFIPPDPSTSGVGSFAIQVSAANTQDLSLLLQQKAPKNGWVYIYLSNESNEDVYFDNFSVTQLHSPISEEDHYYAYGQKIAGICTLAFNKLANKYQYQGSYSEIEENTLWNEFAFRMYDPQTGRWTGVDPYDEFPSPYIGMGDDPVNHIDPSGGDIDDDVLDDLSEDPGGPPIVSSASATNAVLQFVPTYCLSCQTAANAQDLDAAIVTAKVPLWHLVEADASDAMHFYTGVLAGVGHTAIDLIKSAGSMTPYDILRDPQGFLKSHNLMDALNQGANGLAMLLDPTGQKQKDYFTKLYFNFKYATPFDQGNTIGKAGVAVAATVLGQPEVVAEDGAVEGGALLAETPGLAAGSGASEEGTIYFRGGNTFDMSPADLSNSVDKTTGLMKQKGVSLNTDKWNKFVQQYGGAYQVDLSTVPSELRIVPTGGTHFEIVPAAPGMTLPSYQSFLQQIKVFPSNYWP